MCERTSARTHACAHERAPIRPSTPTPAHVLGHSLPPDQNTGLAPRRMASVEGDTTPAELGDEGADPALVHRVARLVDVAEYKRRQYPPGTKISPKGFGKDRRLPITNGYRSL